MENPSTILALLGCVLATIGFIGIYWLFVWLLGMVEKRVMTDKQQILIVDDEPLVGQLFKDTLDDPSYQVTTTLSSLEALELLGNRRFDLIFLNLLIPKLDGAELFQRIRQMDRQIPVAIITGYPDSDMMRRAMEHGPFVVIKKPFTGDDILNTVQGVKAER